MMLFTLGFITGVIFLVLLLCWCFRENDTEYVVQVEWLDGRLDEKRFEIFEEALAYAEKMIFYPGVNVRKWAEHKLPHKAFKNG